MKNPFGGMMVHGLAAGGGLLVALLAVYAGGLTQGRAHAAALTATRPAATMPAVIGHVVVTTTTHLPTPETTGATATTAGRPYQPQNPPDHKGRKPSSGHQSEKAQGRGHHQHQDHQPHHKSHHKSHHQH